MFEAKKRKAGDAFLNFWGLTNVWLTEILGKLSYFVKNIFDEISRFFVICRNRLNLNNYSALM